LNLLVKRFGKYLKRKGIKGNPKRYTSKHNESNSSNFTCYNCEKQGHIKIECPNANKEKEKSVDRKKEKKPKEKRHTLHRRTMMIQQQVAPHKMRVKKPTCVSWLVMSHPPQAK